MTFKLIPFLKNCPLNRNARFLGTKIEVSAELDKDVYESVESKKIHPRKHPGAVKRNCICLPEDVKNAMLKVIGDTPVKQLVIESGPFSRYLHARQLPTEKDVRIQKNDLYNTEAKEPLRVDFENLTDEESDYYNQVIRSKVDVLMKQRLYHWKNINYTSHNCLLYLYTRASPEYAVLWQIFQDINTQLDFKPSTLFDFGSGVGTVVWAANNLWGKSLQQIFCVDSSSNMNDLSFQILQLLDDKKITKKIFQRQFLPASLIENYDIVISSYSLLELPSMTSRLEVILNLWQKTNFVLVLVEYGTKAGFQALNEAREFLLSISKNEETGISSAYVLAPCPHEFDCPKILESHIPCNFQVTFEQYPQNKTTKRELYSYLVICKGKRKADDPNWPRIIQPVLVRSRHAICRMCTPSGSLQEIIFSHSKSGKIPFHCARSTKWGDRLPVTLKYTTTPIKDLDNDDETCSEKLD